MLVIEIIASVILVLGIFFILGKKFFSKLEGLMNRVVLESANTEKKYNRLIGAALIIFSCFLFFIAARLKH